MDRIFLSRLILYSLLLFSGIYLAGAVRMKIGTPTMPGPGFMPVLLGIFLFGTSLISLGVSYKSRTPREKRNEESVLSLSRIKKPLLMCGAVIGYALVLSHLGYVLSVFLLMMVLFKGIEPQGWGTALIASTLTTLVSYLIFIYWLGIQIL
jgi:putative tricarboxylic transport membrane protein